MDLISFKPQEKKKQGSQNRYEENSQSEETTKKSHFQKDRLTGHSEIGIGTARVRQSPRRGRRAEIPRPDEDERPGLDRFVFTSKAEKKPACVSWYSRYRRFF